MINQAKVVQTCVDPPAMGVRCNKTTPAFAPMLISLHWISEVQCLWCGPGNTAVVGWETKAAFAACINKEKST